MWCNGNYHNTIGRIDQFLYPYYRHDLDTGLLTKNEALELLEEFFVSCNRDSDLYIGIQQGDNGQTIVLGGSNEDGSDAYNTLPELCLIASRELCLIDPKVNLRVHKNTPLSVYELATTLTQKGLGFHSIRTTKLSFLRCCAGAMRSRTRITTRWPPAGRSL